MHNAKNDAVYVTLDTNLKLLNDLVALEPAHIHTAQVAARLGTTTHSLYAWIKRYDPQQPKTIESSDPSTELAKLKKELQRVTEEMDILKKAAVYFASQSK